MGLWNDDERQDGRHDDRQSHPGVEAPNEGGIAFGAGCVDAAPGSEIVFAARLDMGILSLADALEPIAARTLTGNIVSIVRGLTGSTETIRSSSTQDIFTPWYSLTGHPPSAGRRRSTASLSAAARAAAG